ncbi:hypothetical protein [Oscillatoria sp. HE19RPO]|uniref:hypothetical protein n=1 Tax=Oscillatoria sp. HE19RPO TaxID=2954806 RepID=UPI0020C2B3EA|nr:hypothetical protein [Oscillatoria sp. HE19RPO]
MVKFYPQRMGKIPTAIHPFEKVHNGIKGQDLSGFKPSHSQTFIPVLSKSGRRIQGMIQSAIAMLKQGH